MRRLFSSFTRLRVRLAFIIAAALAPAGVLAIVQAINAVDAIADRQTDLIEAHALSAVDVERASLIEMRQVLRTTAFETDRVLDEGGDCLPGFERTKTEYDWMTAMVVFDRSGQSRCGSGNPVNVAGFPEWEQFTADKAYTLSAIRIGRQSGKRILVAYYPLPTPTDGAFAIAMGIDVSKFIAISNVDEGDVHVALVDRTGAVITTNEHDDGSWLPANRTALKVFGDRKIIETDASGEERSYFVSSLEAGQLWAVINDDVPTVAENLFTVAGLSVLAPVAIWLIAVLVAYFSVDILVTRHVGELRRVAVRIGEGDLNASISGLDDAPSEIRALGSSITAMRDKISEREMELKTTLEVQRRLLLEIHHRVKNNLQTISSLMSLESSRARSRESRESISAIQSRIHSLAMVHQNLYAAENLEEVALDQLTRDIASHLEESLAPVGEESITSLDLEPLVAPTVLATPIALFLSEALGNAFKHAAKPADIRLSVKQDDGMICLTVSNAVNADRSMGEDGLGSDLMRGFAKQLGGTFDTGIAENRFYVALVVPADRDTDLFSVRKP